MSAFTFQFGSDVPVDDGEYDESGVIRDFSQDSVEMLLRADHRPKMLDDLDTVKLGKRCLGDIFQGLAGRVREQMEVEAVHPISFVISRGIKQGMKAGISGLVIVVPDSGQSIHSEPTLTDLIHSLWIVGMKYGNRLNLH